MASGQRTYTAARFGLELDGTTVGLAASAGGGEAVGQVGLEKVGTDHVIRKHINEVRYEDLELTCGTGMSDEFYDWIASLFDHTPQLKDGAISFHELGGKETGRLSWSDGWISEVGFPALDAASKDTARLTLKITPDSTKPDTPSGSTAPSSGKKPMSWSANSFRLTIDGVDCTHVTRVEPITVRQLVVQHVVGGAREESLESAGLEIPNLVVTLPQAHAKDFVAWEEDFLIKGNNDQPKEKQGKLEFLTQDLKEVLFTLTFKGLGIVRLSAVKAVAGSATMAEVEAEMYCEDMSFAYPKAPAPTTGTTSTLSSPPTGSVTLGDPDGTLVMALRSLMMAGGSPVPPAPVARPPESVAARLLAAEDGTALETKEAGSSDQGRQLGAEWARERATLDELENLAAMRGGDWSHLELGEDHSLLGFLADRAIIIHVFSGGPVDLERDPFVEGLVDGAADVYREVRPHLGERVRVTDIR